MEFPFEAAFEDVQGDLDQYVTAIFSCLESEFLIMPKGDGFVEYQVFEEGYEALKGLRNNRLPNHSNIPTFNPMR